MQVNYAVERPGVQLQHGLRQRILAGEFRPGERFPTFSTLETETGFSRVTVARALRELQRSGFVESRGWRGTFVAQHLPFLHRFALVFPPDYAGTTISRAFLALTAAARQVSAAEGWELRDYNLGRFDPTSRAQSELLADAKAHHIGGAVFFNYADFDLLRAFAQCDVPFVTVYSAAETLHVRERREIGGRMTAICLDDGQFQDKAVNWLCARQRRRVAVIGTNSNECAPYLARLAAAGLDTPPCWLLETGPNFLQAASFVRLLLGWPREKWPDGLIVADDNLVEPVCAAMAEAGLQPGREMDVLAHTNWPAVAPALPGVRRLGYDFGSVIRTAVGSIQAGRRNARQVRRVRIPAVFEEEREETMQGEQI